MFLQRLQTTNHLLAQRSKPPKYLLFLMQRKPSICDKTVFLLVTYTIETDPATAGFCA